jgi:hypothetical protein
MSIKTQENRLGILPWIIVLWAMPGSLWAMTADELTSRTGIAGGLCVFPQAAPEDVALALELARRPTRPASWAEPVTWRKNRLWSDDFHSPLPDRRFRPGNGCEIKPSDPHRRYQRSV